MSGTRYQTYMSGASKICHLFLHCSPSLKTTCARQEGPLMVQTRRPEGLTAGLRRRFGRRQGARPPGGRASRPCKAGAGVGARGRKAAQVVRERSDRPSLPCGHVDSRPEQAPDPWNPPSPDLSLLGRPSPRVVQRRPGAAPRSQLRQHPTPGSGVCRYRLRPFLPRRHTP